MTLLEVYIKVRDVINNSLTLSLTTLNLRADVSFPRAGIVTKTSLSPSLDRLVLKTALRTFSRDKATPEQSSVVSVCVLQDWETVRSVLVTIRDDLIETGQLR